MADDVTAEQRAAQVNLDEAVYRVIRAEGWDKEDMTLTGYALICHQQGFDEAGDAMSAHPIVYMNGSMPDAQALGLFQIGQDIVRGVGRWAREEDDE